MQAFPASDLCHHQNHLPDRLHDDGCGADNRAWMMSSRQSPTTMYRSWVWCTECSSLDVCGTLWTNLLPRTKNKATIEVFAGQSNEESVWETTTYCPSTRLFSRSSFEKGKQQLPFFSLVRFRISAWRDSKAVMQRIANPSSPVRLRVAPPLSRFNQIRPRTPSPANRRCRGLFCLGYRRCPT